MLISLLDLGSVDISPAARRRRVKCQQMTLVFHSVIQRSKSPY